MYSGPLPPTLGLVLAQRALGHTVYLAYDSKRGAFNDFEEAAAPRLEPYDLAPPSRLLTLSAKSSPGELWADLVAVRGLVARREVDVVHMHLSHDHLVTALGWPRHAEAVRVRTFHAARSLLPRFGQAFVNRRADAYLCRCAPHAAQLVERFAVDPARVHHIAAGFDVRGFAPASRAARAAARVRFGLPQDAFVITQVALITDRGQHELVAALAALPSPRPHLLFVGRGEGEAALRATVAQLGMQTYVHFAGYLQGEDLATGYAAADAAFVAQAGNDGSARAALEAMAAGVSLLAVAHEALAEMVTVRRGFPLATRAPVTIAAGVQALMASPAECALRAQAARAYVSGERTFGHEAEQTVAAYEAAREALSTARRCASAQE